MPANNENGNAGKSKAQLKRDLRQNREGRDFVDMIEKLDRRMTGQEKQDLLTLLKDYLSATE